MSNNNPVTITIKLPKRIAEALEAEAKQCGWPISTEILMRLQSDFVAAATVMAKREDT